MNPNNILDLETSWYSRLTEEQSVRMLEACLEILERTGVRLFDRGALDLVRKAGVKIEDSNRVRFPARLVEQAIAQAPKAVTLFNQNGEPVMPVAGYRSFFGPGSDCLHIVDHRTGERRDPTMSDVVDGIIVCDALENIDFLMSMFLPVDVDKGNADRHQMEAMLTYSKKPIVFVTYEMSGCIDAIKMSEVLVGGKQALAEKPFVACYINVTTGLRHNEDALQKLLFLADKGIPFFYVPGAMAGTAGPVTVAGSNAMRMAGALVGLTIAQLKREGAPVFIPGWGALALDMRTTVQSYTGPDHQGVTQAIAHYLKLPMFAEAGTTDAKVLDQQAASEAALTLLFTAITGSQVIHDLGYLESGLSGSLAQIAICDEIISWIKRSLNPVEITDETLALDLIDEIGPDGQYLDSDHTLRHFRDQWHPPLFDRYNFDGWVAKGSMTLEKRAAEHVDNILSTHQPEPLPEEVKAKLRAIVENPTK
jgi:trimethylamine--corrinoid protein Co-methyltransferase